MKTKGVIPYSKTGKAPDDQAWSGPSEVAAADVSDLNIICTWEEDKPPADMVKNDFKLPHHTADGHLLVKNGLIGCGNAIQGARGGVNIPSGDIPGVKSHLEKHYHEFDMAAPWEPKALDDLAIKGDRAEAWTWTAGYAEEDDKMLKEQIEALVKRVGELEAAQKAGRVLSQSNETDLKKANDLTDQVGELIEGVLEQVTGTPVVEPADEGSDVKPPTATPPKAATITLSEGTFEVKETIVVPEVKDDDEIEVDVDTLLGVINEETKEPDDDELVEVSEADLLAVINNEGSTEEV
jgi:hypothetical protein